MKIDSISKFLRGFAIIGIFIENYLSWVSINTSDLVVLSAIQYIKFFGASLVHIFFFLSGYGLVKKYHGFDKFPWTNYANNRFSMIIVPYWIVVLASYFFINTLHYYNPTIFEARFNISDLLSYVFFIRNFNEAAWGLNPTLWFMQAIFGLYIVFPILFTIMNKYGLKIFFIASVLVTYCSRFLFVVLCCEISRENSLFTFYILEFSLGMAFARITDSKQFSIKIGSTNVLYFLVAVLGYAISYILKMKIGIGGNLHDVFTCVGSVALGIFFYQAVAYLKLKKFEKTLSSIGIVAFIIYLIHAPPIQHFIRPILKTVYNNNQGILLVFTLLVGYFILVYFISKSLFKYFKALSIKIESKLKNTFC